MSYDQWKTASPFDDEVDFVEVAEKWLSDNADLEDISPEAPGVLGEMAGVFIMVTGLVDYIRDNV